jgi:ornithine carbamoyltransferase
MPEKLMSKSEVKEALGSIDDSVLKITDLNPEQITALVLDTVRNKNSDKNPRRRLMKDRTLVTLFDKPSLRTYAGTVAAWQNMGGNHITLPVNGSREPIRHAARVIGGYADGLVARLSSMEDLIGYDDNFFNSKREKMPIVSGMTDYDHPLQFLADATTAFEKFPDKAFSKLKIAYLGDSNNVAMSTFLGYCMLGADIRIASPNINSFTEQEIEFANQHNKGNFLLTNNPAEAVADADIIMTDVWTSMGQDKDQEETKSILLPFQVNSEIVSYASPNAIIQHCMPIKLGQEITEEVCDLHLKHIIDQSHNRMHSTQSLLAALYRK